MYYGDGKFIINNDAMLIRSSPRKILIKSTIRHLLSMLDDPFTQQLIGSRKCFVKWKGVSIPLKEIYGLASARGITRYKDIPLGLLHGFR